MRQPANSKLSPKNPASKDASDAGDVCVVLWDERHRFDSGLGSWGDGFFDFSRSLQALNSPSNAGYVQGKYDEGFYLLSEKTRDNS